MDIKHEQEAGADKIIIDGLIAEMERVTQR